MEPKAIAQVLHRPDPCRSPAPSGQPKGNAVMTKANCRNCFIYQRLAEMQLDERDRQLAVGAMRDAEAIADAVIWGKERLESLFAMLPKLGLKH
jgi:hypothetical protein